MADWSPVANHFLITFSALPALTEKGKRSQGEDWLAG